MARKSRKRKSVSPLLLPLTITHLAHEAYKAANDIFILSLLKLTRRPNGQFLAKDFRIVPNIHREFRVKQDVLYAVGVFVFVGHGAQVYA